MTQPKNSGRWKPGQSGNPGGRSGKTEKIRAQLATGAADVAKVVLDKAKAGDMTACRLVLERLVPAVKPVSEPVKFKLDDADLPTSARSILSAIASGQPVEFGEPMFVIE